MKRSQVAAPYIAWMVLFTLVPFFLVLFYAATDPEGNITADNILRFLRPEYVGVLVYSLGMAFFCTVICLLLGYPAALWLADHRIDRTATLIVLFIIPMWMNFLLRTYAWMTLLENNGPITRAVNYALSLIGRGPVRLLYSDGAVQLGMVYNYLPFMVLPIHTVLKKLDKRLIEAAEDLGANGFQVFRRVILPLSIPGVISGITMVFMPAVTTFVISRLLGGAQYMLFGDVIEQQFLFTGNWNFGSALSVIMMIIILISMSVLNRFDTDDGGGVW